MVEWPSHPMSVLLSVNTEEVGDYLSFVSKPMDYGTIITHLEKGGYSPSPVDSASGEVRGSQMDAMEAILLNALRDIHQVHHNCSLYNLRGSLYHRAGEIQARKWNAYYEKHIKERLPETVQAALAQFQEVCISEREGQAPRRRVFAAPNPNNPAAKPVSVFDPDTKRIVKQYSSKSSARTAALMLFQVGYSCERALNQSNVKTLLEHADDPLKLLFGYQWLSTDKIKVSGVAFAG